MAYLPAQFLPFISDDYIQIALAREYGPVSGWAALAADPLYRSRATSLVLTWWTERVFGADPLVFNLSSLLLHILNSWLVLALGFWRVIGWRTAAVAAVFWAVYEGHQEAVIWYAALPEQLVFFFTLSSLLLWLRWLERGRRGGGWWGSLVCFVLALASKESGVMLAAVLPLTLVFHAERRRAARLAWIPHAALAALYAGLIFAASGQHGHFHDGTFSLQAPFALTITNSIGRMLWFWGLLSLIALAVTKARARWPLAAAAGVWAVMALAPYSFLTYMPRVPSRHTYLASVGLALVVAAAFLTCAGRWRRWAPAALAAVILLHNWGYLWIRKQAQYVERAEPTEHLVRYARGVPGPIFVECFPYAPEIAVRALELHGVKSRREVVFDHDIGRSFPNRFCCSSRAFPSILSRSEAPEATP